MTYVPPFDGAERYSSTYSPNIELGCHGLAGRVPHPTRVTARIDTGADFLVLPRRHARLLGVRDLSVYPRSQIVTASGRQQSVIVPNYYVDIQGKLVTVQAEFTDTPRVLLGLKAFLTAVDIGFAIPNWYFKR